MSSIPVPSFGYLFILAAVRVPRTGERQVRKAPGCTGEWWMHGAETLSSAARSSESKEKNMIFHLPFAIGDLDFNGKW